MIVDSSALIVVLRDEPQGRVFRERMESSETLLMSAATLVEASIVTLGRHGERNLELLRSFVAGIGIRSVPVDDNQAELAVDAFRRFGKGRHPAGLNLGDCFSYALSRSTDQPLLFKGEDFARTGVKPAA